MERRRLSTFFKEHAALMCIVPALLWQCYFLYLPLLTVLYRSFDPSLTQYRSLINLTYLKVFANSCKLAVITCLCTLLISYPVAHFLALKVKRFKTIMLAFFILPSWTSYIVQVYSWYFLLKKDGLIHRVISGLWGAHAHSELLFTQYATYIGMVYCYLPFMIFPLFAVLEKIDTSLLEASADLGASRRQTFWKIIVPLSWPGIAAGLVLVFIPAFGEFALPTLLGGNKYAYIGSVIVDKFTLFRQPESGAALVVVGMILPLVCMVSTLLVAARLRRRAAHLWRMT